MSAATDEFRGLAKELSCLYLKRKELAQQIIFKEDRLRHLGIFLEFADVLEEQLEEQQ